MTHVTFSRMPTYGDIWTHYKGDDYAILGVGSNDAGSPEVIYTQADQFKEPPESRPLYVQTLYRFLQQIEISPTYFVGEKDGTKKSEFHPRFTFKENSMRGERE